ncbi:MAG: hypothetical protein QOI10_3338 [Solirubrobacterales bacterium]|nr:hypothetical protein [Solirubrobacterales bacterium]
MNRNVILAWVRRNSVALVALFVALGGTGYAASAINGQEIQNGTIKGKKLRNDTLGGTQVNESKLGKVPSAARADSSDTADRASTAGTAGTANTAGSADTATSALTAGNADTATSALTAGNAGMLDGLDSTAFTRPACTSQSGALKGFARVDGSSTFSSTFTTSGVLFPYNCSGGTVEAERIGAGAYEVRFNGAGSMLALGTALDPLGSPDDAVVSLHRVSGSPAVFDVSLRANSDDSLLDVPFVIALI